eukprot:scaffold22770_cov156-Cylindrotheca_fusiformis.AAC.3
MEALHGTSMTLYGLLSNEKGVVNPHSRWKLFSGIQRLRVILKIRTALAPAGFAANPVKRLLNSRCR